MTPGTSHQGKVLKGPRGALRTCALALAGLILLLISPFVGSCLVHRSYLRSLEDLSLESLVAEDSWVLGVTSHYANYHNGNQCEYFVWIKITSDAPFDSVNSHVKSKAIVFEGDDNFRRVSVSPLTTSIIGSPEYLIEVQSFGDPAFDLACQ
jgi:hypothetical protein